MWQFIALPGRTIKNFLKHRGFLLAAAISFYTTLSIIPLLLLLISIFGYLMETYAPLRDLLLRYLHNFFPASEDIFVRSLTKIVKEKELMGGIGLLALFWIAYIVYFSIEHALNTIWDVRKGPGVWWSPLKFWLIFTFTSVLLTLTVIISSFITFISRKSLPLIGNLMTELGVFKIITGKLIPVITIFLLFFFLYKIVPAKRIKYHHAALGAVFGALLWKLAKIGFDWYIVKFLNLNQFYGSFGAIVMLLLWIYYSWAIFLLGAELIVALWYKTA